MDKDAPPDPSVQDLKELHRGAMVNVAGYIFKLANPVLLAVATHLYGAAHWGIFVGAQAVFILTARICLVGLDKATMWWVPRNPTQERNGLAPVLVVVATTSLVGALVLGWLLVPTAGALGLSEGVSFLQEHIGTVRWMALALLPFCISEVLIQATMGKRRMGAQVFVKETIAPLALTGGSVLLFYTPLRDSGLAVAFLISNLLALAASVWAFSALFRGAGWGSVRRLPPELLRYALPMWGSEFAASLLQRLDILFLGALGTPQIVGIYGIVQQIGNQFRTVRRSFDALVLAVTSSISAQKDAKPEAWLPRLKTAFSRTVHLVAMVQNPALFLLIVLGDEILSLFGPEFVEGYPALVVLSIAWYLAGVLGVCGLVVAGFGRSSWTLANIVASVLLQIILLAGLYLLQPAVDQILFATASVAAVVLTVHNTIFARQAWVLLDRNHPYRASSLRSLPPAIVAAAAGFLVHLSPLPLAPLFRDIAALAVFLLVYIPVLYVGAQRAKSEVSKNVA